MNAVFIDTSMCYVNGIGWTIFDAFQALGAVFQVDGWHGCMILAAKIAEVTILKESWKDMVFNKAKYGHIRGT